jgi:hypothetical protein
VRRSVNDVLVVAGEVAAGGDAFAGRNQVLIGAIGIHDVLLIAGTAVARRLKNDALAVGRPVRFTVRAAFGELLEVRKMTRRLLRQKGKGKQQQHGLHSDHCNWIAAYRCGRMASMRSAHSRNRTNSRRLFQVNRQKSRASIFSAWRPQ